MNKICANFLEFINERLLYSVNELSKIKSLRHISDYLNEKRIDLFKSVQNSRREDLYFFISMTR